MQGLCELIKPFVEGIRSGSIEIYNEFSLQHELGIFLRTTFPTLKIQFERNVAHFFPDNSKFTKREIDISITSGSNAEKVLAIELKFPRYGQVPEQMFSFCKDIAFAEELAEAGFRKTGFLVFAEDHLFYSGHTEGIYGFFRGGRPVHGRIQKPTGRKDDSVEVRGKYSIQWHAVKDALKYATVEVGNDA